jgi:hypothetical protein
MRKIAGRETWRWVLNPNGWNSEEYRKELLAKGGNFLIEDRVMSAHGPSYLLSFTTGGLFLRESRLVAGRYLVSGDWDRVRAEVLEGNLLQCRTRSSLTRTGREVINRLKTLDREELDLLEHGGEDVRRQVLWVAVCRQYRFVREFAVEVIRERLLGLKPDLPLEEFDSFFHRKSQIDPKLESLTETTIRKMRQVLYRILREAGLLDDDGALQPLTPDPLLARHLQNVDPDSLEVLPSLHTTPWSMA